jgi:multidrug resistance efflux pump
MNTKSAIRAGLRPLAIALAAPRRVMQSARFWIGVMLTGIVLLIVYYSLTDLHTPFTSDAYVQAYVVQVAAQVEGQVTAVHVRENQRVAAGELLFEIDPRPFEHAVRQLEGRLAIATQQVAQMQSDLAAARAETEALAAQEAYAATVFEQETAIFQKASTTERKYLDAVQKHKAAQAEVQRSRAVIEQKEQALAARLGDEHALVAQAQAELASARLDLEWTKVYAPADGYVTNLQLRTGSYVRAGQPVLTCIESNQWWIVANYREGNLQHLREGQPVEVSFDTYPGQVFAARVETVGWGVSQGQGVPSGELPNVPPPREWIHPAQRFQVRVVLDDPAAVPLRVGASASATVFTDDNYWLNPVARWWQRVVAWFYYLH